MAQIPVIGSAVITGSAVIEMRTYFVLESYDVQMYSSKHVAVDLCRAHAGKLKISVTYTTVQDKMQTYLSLLTELVQKIAENFSRSRRGARKDTNTSLSVLAELLQVY